jgi:hypothetical protein
MSNEILWLPERTRAELGLSENASTEIWRRCDQCFRLGMNARRDGKARRMPGWKTDIFDRGAWLMGWDKGHCSA